MQDKELLRYCIEDYKNWISKNIDNPVREALGTRPEKLAAVFRELSELMNLIADDRTNIDTLNGKYLSYLKTAILHTLDNEREETKRRAQLTPNLEVKEQLELNVKKISRLTVDDWFERTKAFITPKLDEFLLPQQSKELRIEKEIKENMSSNESIFELKPNIYGLGINLPAVWHRVKGWFKR